MTEAPGSGGRGGRTALRLACGAALITAASLAAYWPALGGQFLWNDRDYVTGPALRSLHGLWRIWFEVNATEQYYPVLHTAFWIEHRIWGDAPLGYHLATLGLHALSACLAAALARRLALPGALLAGVVFALHPVCVESVAWISEQKNTLSTALCLSAALAYLHYDGEAGAPLRRPSPGRYALATLLFVLALLSKSVTATLPVALLVIGWWRRGRLGWRRDLAPLLPWIAAGAAAGLFTGWVEAAYLGAAGPEFALGPAQRAIVAGRAVWFYLGKLLWPSDLTFFYPRWDMAAAGPSQFLYPLGVLAALGALGVLRLRGALAAALAYLALLLPVLGFVNVYGFVFSHVADHWQYLASLAVILPAAAAATRASACFRPGARRLWSAGLVVLACCLGVLTWRQSRIYQSDLSLYRATLEANPGSAMAHHNLGTVLEASGRPAEALAHYQEAVRLQPGYPDAFNDWGVALADLGRTAEAVACYEQALHLRPAFPQAHCNLGSALLALGRDREARLHLGEALRMNPRLAQAHNNLGMVLASQGAWSEAVASYERALKLDPRFADAHNNLGVALAALGRREEAKAQYEEALRANPAFVEALSNLGNVLLGLGRAEEAVVQYREAIATDPRYAQAHFNLGVALEALGRRPEAVAQYREALRLDPGFAPAARQLARLGEPPNSKP